MLNRNNLVESVVVPIVLIMIGFICGVWFGSIISEFGRAEEATESVEDYKHTVQEQKTIPIASIGRVQSLSILVINETVTEPEIEPQPITRDFNVFQPCGYSSEDLSYALSSESHEGLLPYVDTFLEAEETYGVNAFYLMCKLGYESGWGKYEAAENNIGGWTDGRGGFQDFESVEHCILYIAENLSTVYRDAVGERLEDVSRMYCPSDGYVEMLMQIMNERESAIEENY